MSSEQQEPTIPSGAVPETEAELEAFRQQWREEVSARNKRQPALSSRVNEKRLHRSRGAPPPAHATAVVSSAKTKDSYDEDIAPRSYHDLPDKEEDLVLGAEGHDHDRSHGFREPTSALEHYEHAVEKEAQGHLGDSIRHYRQAFKLDDGVHEAYKRKHFPPSAFAKQKASNPNPSNAAATVPGTDHHSLRSEGALPPTLKQLVEGFSALRIEPVEAETSLSEQQPCPIAELPEEILTQVLRGLAVADVASFVRTAQVCKRLAYLVFTEDSIWKRVAQGDEFGFAAMHYSYAVEIEGDALTANDDLARYLGNYDEQDTDAIPPPTSEERAVAFNLLSEQLLHTKYSDSWRQLFRNRPRIRFNGCYISTVNYTRAGATSTNTLTWGAPIHVVTYFRYLRFFRDGSVISLLTTTEPADVVHHLTKTNMHSHHGSFLPSSVMKDALRGRWRLTGPASGIVDSVTGEPENEGEVKVETEGVVPKYTYLMQLVLAHAGKGNRNNKLAWKDFWSYNKLTDDWGRFELRNDRAFYFSRVRSYGMGY